MHMCMASTRVIASVGVLLVSLLALRCGAKEVAVEGTVACQDCDLSGTWDLSGSRPLSNVEVGVECEDGRGNRTFHDSFLTDFNGYFYAFLKGVEDLDGVACKARLLSSSDPACDELTQVGEGFEGCPIRFLKHLLDVDLYTVGPFAFRPGSCPGGESGNGGFGDFGKGFGDGELGKGFGDEDGGKGFGKGFGDGEFGKNFGNGMFGGNP